VHRHSQPCVARLWGGHSWPLARDLVACQRQAEQARERQGALPLSAYQAALSDAQQRASRLDLEALTSRGLIAHLKSEMCEAPHAWRESDQQIRQALATLSAKNETPLPPAVQLIGGFAMWRDALQMAVPAGVPAYTDLYNVLGLTREDQANILRSSPPGYNRLLIRREQAHTIRDQLACQQGWAGAT
jgi:hypothetical protein